MSADSHDATAAADAGAAALQGAASRRRSGLLLAAIGAILFSAKAILAKLQYRHGIDALDVMALRMAFALPLFLALAVREAHRARSAARALSRRDALVILVLGVVGYYLSSLLDFWGLEYVPVALERLILFLNPTFVLLIGLLVFRTPVSARQWLAMGVCYAGVALVMAENLRIEGEHIVLGSVLILGAALSYAIYLAGAGELVKRLGSQRLVSLAMIVSTAAALIHYAFRRDLSGLAQFAAPVYWLAIANAIFCTFLPVTFTMMAVARIGSGPTAQLSALGPVSLVFLGGVILGERITLLQIAGTAVVLAGVLVLSRAGANSIPLPNSRTP